MRRDEPVDGPFERRRHGFLMISQNDERRRKYLALELRKRRRKYLPVYEVFLVDMKLYWRDVHEWRAHRKDCKRRGVKPSMLMPEMPPCPSHLPSEEELLEMVKQGKANKLQPRKRPDPRQFASNGVPIGGRVERLAMAASADLQTKSQKDLPYKGADAEGGHQLCDEVAVMLAPSASHPVPVATMRVHRPLQPSPV